MQNSVAKYPFVSRWPAPPAPAPWGFEKVSGRPVDGPVPGLWCCPWPRGGFDALTPQNPGVKAVSKWQAIDCVDECATFDTLTANPDFPSRAHARGRAHVNGCMCHNVKTSIVYIYLYNSTSYNFDTGLTPFDTLPRLQSRQGRANHCLCSAGGWGGAH